MIAPPELGYSPLDCCLAACEYRFGSQERRHSPRIGGSSDEQRQERRVLPIEQDEKAFWRRRRRLSCNDADLGESSVDEKTGEKASNI